MSRVPARSALAARRLPRSLVGFREIDAHARVGRVQLFRLGERLHRLAEHLLAEAVVGVGCFLVLLDQQQESDAAVERLGEMIVVSLGDLHESCVRRDEVVAQRAGRRLGVGNESLVVGLCGRIATGANE